VRSLPEGLLQAGLLAGLAEGWGLDAARAAYLPVGFGSHHWDVTDAAGRRRFVTVDDLDHKGWLGTDRDTAFAGLRAAFDPAVALRHDAGLPFVVAPLPASDGASVRRLDARYAVSVFPFVEGSGAGWGGERTAEERAGVIGLLAALHRATPAALPFARRRHLDLPRRGSLEVALRELDRPWTGGPFSEPAREVLAAHTGSLLRRLAAYDRLAGQVAAAPEGLVVTHGEPHPGNVLHVAGGLALVDWDTVGLAPPERDLWHVTADPDELDRYTEATGHRVDAAAIALYRLRWDLDDISIYTAELRSPHARTADTEQAFLSLRGYVRSQDGGA